MHSFLVLKATLRSADGTILLTDKEAIMQCWSSILKDSSVLMVSGTYCPVYKVLQSLSPSSVSSFPHSPPPPPPRPLSKAPLSQLSMAAIPHESWQLKASKWCGWHSLIRKGSHKFETERSKAEHEKRGQRFKKW